jgi:hypothetical protein
VGTVLIDDRFFTHPLARRVGKDGRALFIAGACLVAEERTVDYIDGDHLPEIAREAGVRGPSTARKLVEVRMWTAAVRGGWHITSDLVRISYSGSRESIPTFLRDRVLQRDGHACVKCGAADDLHIDHRMPVALGGRSTASNLQVLCRPCNLAKGAKHPDVWEAMT